MRLVSALAVLAVVLGLGVLVGQTARSPTAAGKAPTDYRLDDGIGALALYPGTGYRSFVEAKFLVSSLNDVESRISQLPRGATLHWLPRRMDSYGNPILFERGQYEQFARFCSDHGVQILIERTYRPHLNADGSYSRTVVALGDDGKTPIEFRSLAVHLASNTEGTKDYILRMLYDPKTKLFYQQNYGLYQGYAPEGDANLADQWLGSIVIYVRSDQMAIFGVGFDGNVGVVVSSKRATSLDEGQASVIHGLGRGTKTPLQKSTVVTYSKPADFFKQCMTDINMPRLQGVQRQTNQWQVTVAAQNGNIAVLSLDDSYNLISTRSRSIPTQIQSEVAKDRLKGERIEASSSCRTGVKSLKILAAS
jgi:hypothetical protein